MNSTIWSRRQIPKLKRMKYQ